MKLTAIIITYYLLLITYIQHIPRHKSLTIPNIITKIVNQSVLCAVEDVGGIPFVDGGVRFQGVTDGDYIKRDQVVGE